MEGIMEGMEGTESMEASMEAVEAPMEASIQPVTSARVSTPRRSRGLALPLPSNLAPNQRPVTYVELTQWPPDGWSVTVGG